MAVHGLQTAPFWLAMGGVVLAWFFYLVRPGIPAAIQRTFRPIHSLLENKYFFDRFNEIVFAGGARLLGKGLWKGGGSGPDRRHRGQWLGEAGGLGGADVAPVPDRPPLPVRLHDDHRRVRAAHLLVQPRLRPVRSGHAGTETHNKIERAMPGALNGKQR